LIDDEADLLATIAEYLGAVGYDVTAEASGRRGRERILDEGQHFDAVLVDWMLPDVPGRELVLLVRRLRPACRILVTTAHGSDVVGESVVGAGVAAVLRKPFTMQRTREAVAAALAEPQAQG